MRDYIAIIRLSAECVDDATELIEDYLGEETDVSVLNVYRMKDKLTPKQEDTMLEEGREKDHNVIKVVVEGGVVTNVENLPHGWLYELDDKDALGDG